MAEDTTTIEVTEAQADELREIGGEQAYKHTVAELIDAYGSDAPESDHSEQLDRIEAAAKEATNAAQNAEQAAEELKR